MSIDSCSRSVFQHDDSTRSASRMSGFWLHYPTMCDTCASLNEHDTCDAVMHVDGSIVCKYAKKGSIISRRLQKSLSLYDKSFHNLYMTG